MTEFAGIFEVLAADQSDARLASRKALVLARNRIDARLGKFLGASRSPQEFDARYDLVSEDFTGIVRVAASEVGHDDPDALVETLRAHYADKEHWIQDAVKKPGDLHKKLDVPEDEKIPEDKIEHAEETGDKNLKEKAQFAENVKGLGKGKKESTVSDYLSSYYASDDDDGDIRDDDIACKKCGEKGGTKNSIGYCTDCAEDEYQKSQKKSKKTKKKDKDSKPPWLKDDDDDDDSDDDSLDFTARTAAPAGNTALDGPSPKMDKQRWTPKSVPHDEYDHGKNDVGDHKEMDITEVLPKENEGPPGDIGNIDEIGAATTKTETLPTAKGMDDSGFNADKNTGDSGPTKTWGTDGREADPVRSESLGA